MWLFAALWSLVGAIIGGQTGALIGALVGLGVFWTWAIWDHLTRKAARRRAEAVEYEEAEADVDA